MKQLLLFLLLLSPVCLFAQQVNPNGYNIFKYPNGNISAEGRLRNGKPDGLWKNYFVSGKVKSIVFRKNYELDSTCLFFTEKGDTTERITYAYGKKNGFYSTYQISNDTLKNLVLQKEMFVNDIRQQWAFYYYPNGAFKQKIMYKDGNKQGESKVYNLEGKISEIQKYLNDRLYEVEKINRLDRNSVKQGIWREYWANENIKTESFYVNGFLDGYVKEFNEAGKLLHSVRYEKGVAQVAIDEKDSLKVEIKQAYSEDGKLKESGGYKNDKPVGIHKKYDETGKATEAIVYNNQGFQTAKGGIDTSGTRQGKWDFFFETGEKRCEGEYKNNFREGKWTYYYPNGKVEQTGNYVKSKAVGTWRWYYDTGELLREEEYKNGKHEGQSTEFAKDKSEIAKGKYLDDQKEGEWFYHVGDHTEKGTYKAGLKIGKWQYFYLSQKLQFEGEFLRDMENGKQKYYYENGTLKIEGKCQNGKRDKKWVWYDNFGNILTTIIYDNDKEIKVDGKRIN